MKRLFLLIIVALLFLGCMTSSNTIDKSNGKKYIAPTDKTSVSSPGSKVVMYYGTNLGQFPPHIQDWIINKGFPKEKMEKSSMLDPGLKAWWSDDGNAVHFEASYTIADGYKGAGTRKTWGTKAVYQGPNLSKYGEHAIFQTLKYQYQLKLETENFLKTDPAYYKVIEFAKQLCSEIEYDWQSYNRYKGSAAIRTPGMRYAVCSGYSKEVMEKILALDCINSVEEWSSTSHSWNVLNLVDGRVLYFDLTWFDNEYINHETGEVYRTDDYDWENISFNRELFKYSNLSYSGSFAHAQGTFKQVVNKYN